MENKKHSAVMTILEILLCLSFCIGFTYAFFTDSATSKGNYLQSGGVFVDLELLDSKTPDKWDSIKEYHLRLEQERQEWEESYEEDDNGDPLVPYPEEIGIFNYDLWEPGYTDVKIMRVVNTGDLALEWRARFWLQSGITEIADVIDVYIIQSESKLAYPTQRDEIFGADSEWTHAGTLAEFFKTAPEKLNGILKAPEGENKEFAYFGIALHMQEDAGNEYQGVEIRKFEFRIEAIQVEQESDAIDTDYDNGANYPGSENDLVFEPIEDDETGDIIGYSVSANSDGVECQDVVIPATYNGLPVKSIASYGFEGQAITSIIIPNSVTRIGEAAFSCCFALTKVVIPDSVTFIGGYAFEWCQDLASVTLPTSLERISSSTFSGCGSLKTIDLPTNLTSIGDEAFYSSGIEEIVIPNNVTHIGSHAFALCKSLERATLSANSTPYLTSSVFLDCTALTDVTLPEGMTTLGYSTFEGCSALKEITIPGSIEIIEDYSSAFSGCENLESITISEGTRSIGAYAFSGCIIKKVTIPTSVTSIGSNAFPTDFEGMAIVYLGTRAQWNSFGLSNQLLPSQWSSDIYYVTCADGNSFIVRNY